MKIIIERGGEDEGQFPVITINTKSCYYPQAMRRALQTALKLDGVEENTINEIFGRYPDKVKGKE